MPSPLAADVAVCRQNFVVFCQVVLSEEQSNRPVVLAPHHRSLVDVLDLAWEEGKHCFLLAPVRHGKTTLLEGLVLYMLGNYRWTRTKIASANQDIAQDRTAKIRRLLKESGRVQALWPDLRIVNPDRPEKIFIDRAGELARDAALHAVGVATGVTGSSVDVLLLDDVDDPRTQSSSRRRRIVQTSMLEGLLSRCEPGTVACAIATRWHPKDCYGVVLEDEGMRSRWVLYQEATADDLTSIKGSCVGDTRSLLLPLGWRAAVRPDDLDEAPADEGDAVDDDLDETGLEDNVADVPPLQAHTSQHDDAVRLGALVASPYPVNCEWCHAGHQYSHGNGCYLCHQAGYHLKFQALGSRDMVTECRWCRETFAAESP